MMGKRGEAAVWPTLNFMPLIVNLRHLEVQDLHLQGEIPVADLDIETHDEIVQAREPLVYDLEVQAMDEALLLTGRLRLPLACECARCLKPFVFSLDLTGWTCHIPLEGEESAPVVNDLVDLTPYLREDILLELPQHPLCTPACPGLPGVRMAEPEADVSAPPEERKPSAWGELDKLKL